MFKRRKLFMLPSNNKAGFKVEDIGLHPVQGLFINKNPNLDNIIKAMPKAANYIKQYLYIISNDEIKYGDWCIDTVDNNFIFRITNSFIKNNPNYKDYCEKIIATNDNSLWEHDDTVPYPKTRPALPEPSQSFIEVFVREYNKGNIITDVLVEYEPIYLSVLKEKILGYKLKISKDNTITIKKVKNSWNREEVESLLSKLTLDLRNKENDIEFNAFMLYDKYLIKMEELIEKFEKETGLEFYTVSLDKGEDLYSYDFVNWLIKQLPDQSEQLK